MKRERGNPGEESKRNRNPERRSLKGCQGKGKTLAALFGKPWKGKTRELKDYLFCLGGDFKRTLGIIVGGFWRPQGLLGPSMSYYFGRLIPPRIFIHKKTKLF